MARGDSETAGPPGPDRDEPAPAPPAGAPVPARPPSRLRRWLPATRVEVLGFAAVTFAFSLYALWRMDYLSAETAHHIRMCDNTRSAYVAKQLVEGRGYTTNDMPAFLVDFYAERGKLHDARWTNADRFPFTAFAIAALYQVTGSTSAQVGILLYNLLCFTGFLTLLFWMARSIWRDRLAGVLAVALALLHPYTYVFLYHKDADMLLLTGGLMVCAYRYFSLPRGTMRWPLALALGTLLGWMCLARPNIGFAFLLFFGLVALRWLWRSRREPGLGAALRALLLHEGLALAVALLWCVPFVIHSMSEWGSPLFSSNAQYQLPLGTRYAMGTDTWWKYTDPDVTVTLGGLLAEAPGEVAAKFTTSWVATLKNIVGSYAMELFLAIGLLVWLQRRPLAVAASPLATRRAATANDADDTGAIRMVAAMIGFAFLVNFVILPLYGYLHCSFRHYLSFFMPLMWLFGGRALSLLLEHLAPAARYVAERVRRQPVRWLAIAVVVVVVWNFGSKAHDINQLFARTGAFVGKHWLSSLILLVIVLGHRWFFRRPAYPRIVVAVALIVFFRYQPARDTKGANLNFFPANTAVWDVLAQAKGTVAAFAMQGEVAWVSDRKTLLAPELPMHIYSVQYDHGLAIEDVYIESAETMIGPTGAFTLAAAGFEGYARLQRFRGRMPGYDVVFHDATMKGYPAYKIKPRPKASTVYRMVDPDAVRAFRATPERIELGRVENVIHTAHGFGDYVVIDGKPAVAATDVTRQRYGKHFDQPWEDASVTFFVDARRPTSVELEIYATHPTVLQFYWNLDLYRYEPPGAARDRHAIGTYEVKTPGWQTVRLAVPPGLTRQGLNKLGFRTAMYQPVVVCPPASSDETCTAARPRVDPAEPDGRAPVQIIRDATATVPVPMRVSAFVGTLALRVAGP